MFVAFKVIYVLSILGFFVRLNLFNLATGSNSSPSISEAYASSLFISSENQTDMGKSCFAKEALINMEMSMNLLPLGAQFSVNRLPSTIYNF